MERARRRQHFQAQFEALSQELRDVLAAGPPDGANALTHMQLVLELRYQIGVLCTEYEEFRLAQTYFQQLLTSLSDETVVNTAMAGALRSNTLNWLAATSFRAGSQNEAMEHLLQATAFPRDVSTGSMKPPGDKLVAANYALFLHARGNTVDAEHAAQSVINKDAVDRSKESNDDVRARSMAMTLLSSIYKAQNKSKQAYKHAKWAVSLADRAQDPHLISRAHNTLGIFCLEQRNVERALSLFTSSYRAAQQSKDLKQQAIVKYHLGLALSYLGRDWDESEEFHDDGLDDGRETGLQSQLFLPLAGNETDAWDSTEGKAATVSGPSAKTPRDLFLESENLMKSLPEPDRILCVLTQCCRGEEEYYRGDFSAAEDEFLSAMEQLKELSKVEVEQDQSLEAMSEAESTGYKNPAASVKSQTMANSAPIFAKLQGRLFSYIGCTQLMQGEFALAEHSHKRDLTLALQQEDLDAQHRALRNLATVANLTNRYQEAISLWREVLELSVVLDSKRDQLMAYSGLGSALCELLRLKGPAGIAPAERNQTSVSLDPLQVSMKQRALAIQVEDVQQQLLAQKQIVSVYESSFVKPQSESETAKILDRRLAECRAFVRLCEKHDSLQYRADAYRSLANALTSQVVRLRARVKGTGTLAQRGLQKLIQERDGACTKYHEAIVALSAQNASMSPNFDGKEIEDKMMAARVNPNERCARPPLFRLEILQRQ